MTKLMLIAATTATAISAHAVLIPATHLTDTQVNTLLVNKTFAAEARIGDSGAVATFEQGIQQPVSGYFATANYNWTSGQTLPFSVVFNATTRKIDYTIGSQLITTTLAPSEVNGVRDLFFRLRALRNDQTASTVTLANLKINGASITGPWSTSTPSADNYLVKGTDITAATGTTLAQGFTLTGDQTLTWAGVRPSNSNLAYQIKVAEAVPEPASVAALGLGLAGILRRRRNR